MAPRFFALSEIAPYKAKSLPGRSTLWRSIGKAGNCFTLWAGDGSGDGNSNREYDFCNSTLGLLLLSEYARVWGGYRYERFLFVSEMEERGSSERNERLSKSVLFDIYLYSNLFCIFQPCFRNILYILITIHGKLRKL